MGTVRTMISLPSELKERMDSIKGDVNWSAVAREAIEQTLAKVEKPAWSEVELQEYRNGGAGDIVLLKQYLEDINATLGVFATSCKDGRHSDPAFRDWYQGMRDRASRAMTALEELQRFATKYE